MQILKKIFLDENVQLFTSSKDLHYLSKLHLYKTSMPDTQWVIPHRMKCSEIITQVFQSTENNTFEAILPDSIIHREDDSTISFFNPQDGVALLVCPRVVGELDWIELAQTLNLINSGWINRTSGIN